jgi:hypothetical protein
MKSTGYVSRTSSPTHLIEQDYRGVNRVTQPVLGFKSFEAVQSTLVGIELTHILRKVQLVDQGRLGPQRGRPVLLPGHLIPSSAGLTQVTAAICENLLWSLQKQMSPNNAQ